MTEDSPPPPAILPSPRAEEIVTDPGPLTRIYKRAGAHPASWAELRRHGPLAGARFDPHPEPPGESTVGAAYVAIAGRATAFDTAVAEAFQTTGTIDPGPESHWLAVWIPLRPLELLDVSSAWTLRAGGTQALAAGDRRRSRQWARAIHEQFGEQIDGVAWDSSVLGGGRVAVLWERAADSFPDRPEFNRFLGDPALAGAVAATAKLVGYRAI